MISSLFFMPGPGCCEAFGTFFMVMRFVSFARAR